MKGIHCLDNDSYENTSQGKRSVELQLWIDFNFGQKGSKIYLNFYIFQYNICNAIVNTILGGSYGTNSNHSNPC